MLNLGHSEFEQYEKYSLTNKSKIIIWSKKTNYFFHIFLKIFEILCQGETLPFKSPRSLSFDLGITNNAINESVANGDPNVERTRWPYDQWLYRRLQYDHPCSSGRPWVAGGEDEFGAGGSAYGDRLAVITAILIWRLRLRAFVRGRILLP